MGGGGGGEGERNEGKKERGKGGRKEGRIGECRERGEGGKERRREGRGERGISPPPSNFLISPTIAHPNHFTVQLSRTGAKESNRFFSTHTLPVVFRTS